jgi:hypothetical protein
LAGIKLLPPPTVPIPTMVLVEGVPPEVVGILTLGMPGGHRDEDVLDVAAPGSQDRGDLIGRCAPQIRHATDSPMVRLLLQWSSHSLLLREPRIRSHGSS